MPDRLGTSLKEGDPVIYILDQETTGSATVIGVLSRNRYLVQLDPREPGTGVRGAPTDGTSPAVVALHDQVKATVDHAKALGIDVQESFEVSGDSLEYFGEWGDEE